MPGVRITFAPAAAANLIPSPSSINSASEPSSVASTMASLSPGCRPAKRSLSASRVSPICRTESQEAVAASTACATGMWVPPQQPPQTQPAVWRPHQKGRATTQNRPAPPDIQEDWCWRRPRLSNLASSFEFGDGFGIRFPIIRSVSEAWDTAPLQQIHERKPPQAQFAGGFTGGDLATREQGQDGFL